MPLNVKVEAGASKDDHGTPTAFFEQVNRVFRFTIDVCANEENAVLPRWFCDPAADHDERCGGVAFDGLAQSWAGERCWMNPPYSRGQIENWLKKAMDEMQFNGVTTVALLPASSDTRWWHTLVKPAAIVVPVRGRVKFVGQKAGAKFANVIAIYLPEITAANAR